MEKKSCYINGIGLISPQRTFGQEFLAEPLEYVDTILHCVTPDFTSYINPVQLRRLSRMLRIRLSAAIIFLRDAKNENPDGVITSTGYGFLVETTWVLTELLTHHATQLTPTNFMQSTYNHM